ncbi:hypothetical protein EG68_12566 [Paragonimus skrjabini miyazakii]|uniref:Uncharacterized protein n=1 Tax=Paragonimus skrjabini miyazakii TaxID=59628 RepID=A0A8S9YGY0_9TREM|nr:hypothetical protein EG68_12566 [Paragonimus skrjabini miyazakii]
MMRMFQEFAAKQEELIRDVTIVKERLNQRRLFPDVDVQGEAVREIRSHALPRQQFRTMDHLKEAIGSQLAVEMTYAGGKNRLAFKDTILRRVIEETVLSQECVSPVGTRITCGSLRCTSGDPLL